MDVIEREEFNKVKAMKKQHEESEEMTGEEFKKKIEAMQNPVAAQREVAAQIKIFLDKRIKTEMKEKGYLSDHTRRWVETFNNILEKIQKALYGDKSMNLHLHKVVSHSQVAARIRDV